MKLGIRVQFNLETSPRTKIYKKTFSFMREVELTTASSVRRISTFALQKTELNFSLTF